MKITQDNYEQYFLDHAEGNLSPEMERELADFLDANPGLRSVLDGFDPSPLQTVEMHNDLLKAKLKKHIHPTVHIRESDVDEWLIREIEGFLDESEKNELDEFIALNPAYVYDRKLFSLTKLIPEESIIYKRKNELKKKAPLVPIYGFVWSITAVAAVILLIISIRFFQKSDVSPIAPFITPEAVVITNIPETPSQLKETPSQLKETPSQLKETPSQISRSAPFRLNPVAANAIFVPDKDMASGIRLTAYHTAPIQTVENKEKPLIAKVFSNMIGKVQNGISNRTNIDRISKTDFSFWSIAKAGVEGYNNISDRDLELYVRKNEEGKVKSYALVDQDRLLWSKELNKN